MSTKDISRSALEGGRSNYNKNERNQSHRHERSRAKVWLDTVKYDIESAEESDPVPRNHVSKGFTDKLGPCWGWLTSHCGQPWSEVFSELASTFDTRKLSAWHIVNQHMLSEIHGAGTKDDGFGSLWRSQRFYIDEDGILRDRGKYRRRSYKDNYTGPSAESVLAYAKGRKVRPDYDWKARHWCNPQKTDQWEACKAIRGRCPIAKDLHRYTETTPAALIEKYSSPGYRNLSKGDWWRTYTVEHHVLETWTLGKKFTKKENVWWDSISYEIRAQLYVPR